MLDRNYTPAVNAFVQKALSLIGTGLELLIVFHGEQYPLKLADRASKRDAADVEMRRLGALRDRR